MRDRVTRRIYFSHKRERNLGFETKEEGSERRKGRRGRVIVIKIC